MANSFNALTTLPVDGHTFRIYKLDALKQAGLDVSRLPYSLKILLENLLRNEDGLTVTADDIRGLAEWDPKAIPSREIAFRPSRVLLQDFTGVPAVVDLAAMRDAMKRMGGDPKKINPLQPVELVIDHSVQVDEAGTRQAFQINADLEFSRNGERYAFLRWGQDAFKNFRVVPPDTGIVHQVNLEYLARVVFTSTDSEGGAAEETPLAYPDTLVGTDSHTTMINGLGVLGWGVGGIEAEAAMLGQPVSMLVPQVVGFKLSGSLPEGATATDLVLTVTEMLRRKGVVGKFVEFYGDGLATLPLADRATIANMAPEYGATCGIFPVDAEIAPLPGALGPARRPDRAWSRPTARRRGCSTLPGAPRPSTPTPSSSTSRRSSRAWPARSGRRTASRCTTPRRRGRRRSRACSTPAPQPRPATDVKSEQRLEGEGGGGTAVGVEDPTAPAAALPPAPLGLRSTTARSSSPRSPVAPTRRTPRSWSPPACSPRRPSTQGLTTKPWVKASLAPGSKVVTDYLKDAGLDAVPRRAPVQPGRLRLHDLHRQLGPARGSRSPRRSTTTTSSSPPSSAATATSRGGSTPTSGPTTSPRPRWSSPTPWPARWTSTCSTTRSATTRRASRSTSRTSGRPRREVHDTIQKAVQSPRCSTKEYGEVFEGDERWNSLDGAPGRPLRVGRPVDLRQEPALLPGDARGSPPPVAEIKDARVLAVLGDSITTDHISPAGSIKVQSPAGKYLIEHGVAVADFNSYGSRRGNHEVMVRGTFANIRLRNKLAPGTEGGVTRHLPDGEAMSIFDASERYQQEGVPLIILAGKEYGSGSSRDWAAKGPKLLGIRAVIAESYERIHRSNLVGMGILPLQFGAGDNAESLGLTGEETLLDRGPGRWRSPTASRTAAR